MCIKSQMVINERVLSHINQILLDCAVSKSWAILISQGVFEIELSPLDFNIVSEPPTTRLHPNMTLVQLVSIYMLPVNLSLMLVVYCIFRKMHLDDYQCINIVSLLPMLVVFLINDPLPTIVSLLGGNLVIQCGIKQNVMDHYSIEAEYKATAHITFRMLWVYSILNN